MNTGEKTEIRLWKWSDRRKANALLAPQRVRHLTVRVSLDLLKTLQNNLSHMFESSIIMIQTWLVGLISTPSLSRWLRDVSHLLWTHSELHSCRWARRCSPLSQRWGTAVPSSAGSDTDRWARPRQTWGINQWDKLLTSLPFKQHEDDNFISTPPPECEAWKEKHTWWTNVVLKQELWRIWIMDSFQFTRVSAPLCKKKKQQRKYSNTWFDCSPKWPDEKTLTPNVRTVFSLRRTVLQELRLRIDFLGQSVSWFSSSITMGPEKSQASTTNTGWFMDEWKREAY